MKSGLYLVSTPIGNLADMTRRGEETLRAADVVYAEDTRRTGRLLEAIGAETGLRSLHEHNERARIEEILGRLEAGEACALVSDAGTPTISDPGRRVVAAVRQEGGVVVPVPGPSAVLAALSASGLPGDRFAFLGFPPRKGAERERWLDQLERQTMTVVAFESPRRVHDLLCDWSERGLDERRCVVGRELTKKFEEIRSGTVAALRELYEDREIRGEVTLVLEGGDAPDWRDERERVVELARDLIRAGDSTRDVVARLGREHDVPRNDAYELALRLEREES